MAVPNTFTGGTPAVAADVNENFTDLDTRIDAVASDLAAEVAARGIELGFAESDQLHTNAAAAAEDVPGLSITFTEGDRPYYVEVQAGQVAHNTALRNTFLLITDASNNVLATATQFITTANTGFSARARVRITPTGGTKTYKVRLQGAGTGVPFMSNSGSQRATLSAVEV